MKLLPALILAFFVLFAGSLSAQDIFPAGARSEALAGSSVAITGSSSVFGNQAGLAEINRPEVGGSFQSRFLIQELSGKSGLFVLPIQSSVFALSLYQFGEIPFRQEKFGISYARKISPKLNFGVQFNYYRLYLSEDNKSAGSSGLELGFQYAVNKLILLGAHVQNPYRTGIKTYSGKYFYPSKVNVGVFYRPTNSFSLTSEIEGYFDRQIRLIAGLEYQILDYFFVRAGVSGKPVQLSGGFGFQIRKLTLDLATSYHSWLGNSPSVSFQYQF